MQKQDVDEGQVETMTSVNESFTMLDNFPMDDLPKDNLSMDDLWMDDLLTDDFYNPENPWTKHFSRQASIKQLSKD
jgi:hypothetical protein